ncbi:MAG: hypothetical protein JNG52_02500 [Muribaculaceae bacterium]|nr:hypothetical protein [Muribaculaceae bacterium]
MPIALKNHKFKLRSPIQSRKAIPACPQTGGILEQTNLRDSSKRQKTGAEIPQSRHFRSG